MYTKNEFHKTYIVKRKYSKLALTCIVIFAMFLLFHTESCIFLSFCYKICLLRGICTNMLCVNPFSADHDFQAFADSLEPDLELSNSASGQVPSCLPLNQYFFQILRKLIKI